MSTKCVWITWEDHRRSRELAKALGVEYRAMTSNRKRAVRYPLLSVKVIYLLASKRPGTVFCQNPSIILATVVCALKGVFGYTVCIDRHSNFKLEHSESNKPIWKIFHYLSKWTVRKADLTIVTNSFLYELVKEWGGRPYILQDKLPNMAPTEVERPLPFLASPEKKQIMCVTTFSGDEPVEEIFQAAESVDDAVFYLTGNYSKSVSEDRRKDLLASGVVLTGFVSDQDYVDLMYRCDVVVVLTTKENLLTCGAYEAMSLRKPLVLSDTRALKDYFRKGAFYVGSSSEEIASGIRAAFEQKVALAHEINDFLPELEHRWNNRFAGLRSLVESSLLGLGRSSDAS